jgi:hypothetical protein
MFDIKCTSVNAVFTSITQQKVEFSSYLNTISLLGFDMSSIESKYVAIMSNLGQK